jgi:hypothetical protein
MRKTLLAIASVVFTIGSLLAQHPARTSFLIPQAGINDGSVLPDPNVSVQCIERPAQTSTGLQRTKDSLSAIYRNRGTGNARESQQQQVATLPLPVVGSSFAGNGFNNGTPTDNEVAIGNNGQLISVQNSTVFKYNTNSNTNLGLQSLTLFFTGLGVTAGKYDPKVLYDPQANRFIVVCLAGYASNNTHILVAFSNSDSINGTWHLYEFPGNPFNDTLWTDYPMISVNNNELFITVNLLHDNQPWQTGFVESVVWQVNKWDGYSGDSVRTELHSGINTNGRAVRNLCPVEAGALPTSSPGMYFVSDRNLDASNDTIFLVYISDTANSPTQTVTVNMLESNISYWAPIPADQPGTGGSLQTNDARILGAFMENNMIQFVCASLDTSTGNDGIYHGIIQNPSASPTIMCYLYSDTLLDYGYPNIAWCGYNGTDNTAMIIFLHSDSTVFPGYSVMLTDAAGGTSPRVQVKAGLGYVSIISGDERWGDYTGIQRRYDAAGTCWVNGYYGLSNHYHATWVSEIGRSSDVGIAVHDSVAIHSVYPNPFEDNINITFSIPTRKHIRFAVYDLQGRLVEVLMEDEFKSGKSILSFSTAGLAPGTYLIRGEVADGSVLFTEKVIAK